MKAEYIDKNNGRPICGRCAAEAGEFLNDANICEGLKTYSGKRPCWSCQQMENESHIIED